MAKDKVKKSLAKKALTKKSLAKKSLAKKSLAKKVKKSIPLDPIAMDNLYYISDNVMDAMFYRGIAHPTIKPRKAKRKRKK